MLVGGVNQASSPESSPVVTADERTIYFSSMRAGTQLRDVFVADRALPSEAFGVPRRVAELSTDTNDEPSWLSADGCRIVIASGGTSDARADIYLATRPP